MSGYVRWGAARGEKPLHMLFLKALKAWQALCFRDIQRKRGSPVRGSVQASFRGTFRRAFWELFGLFLDTFGGLGASFSCCFYVVFGVCFRTRLGSLLDCFFVAFGSFLKPFGSLGATFGRLLANFGSFGGGF